MHIQKHTILLLAVLALGIGLIAFNQADTHTDTAAQNTAQNQLPMDAHNAHMAGQTNTASPTMPGQEAFGAIQEIMEILDADPQTDWEKVDIEALRQHLIDMHELTLNAKVETQTMQDGFIARVTGETDRTVEAIQRMSTTHNQMTLSTIDEWKTSIEILENGIEMAVAADTSEEITKIQALGFIGVMATGADHPTHHLMMARGGMHME